MSSNGFTRLAVLLYSGAGYLTTMVAILYLIAFLGGFNVPGGVRQTNSPLIATLINVCLLILFGLQHSIMAREGFKRRLCRIVPEAAERTTYGFAAAAVSLMVIVFWQPIPQVVWQVEHNLLRLMIWGGFWIGIGLAIVSTFAISHLDFFGVRQGLLFWRQQRYEAPPFQMPLLYRLVRHPMMTGLLIAFWVIPEMTVGRLLFAVGMSLYILIGTRFEEHSLEQRLGEPYRRYHQRTPAFLPRMRLFQVLLRLPVKQRNSEQ